jgi:methionyl-tRNA formyltransferase
MKKLKAIYMGTPDFSVPALEMLSQHPGIELTLVVSMPDRPAGRGQQLKSPPVIEFAKEHKLPILQAENVNKSDEFAEFLESNQPDIIIVLAFAQFLGSKILNAPKVGCFNIHTSLLPKYRGAAPIQYALLNGDESSGVSIQKMVKEMDAGDLVHSHPVSISENETGGSLYTRLKLQAALSLNEFIENLHADKVTYTPQDPAGVSFAPTLKKEDGHLKFAEESSVTIFNKVRALKPWPGTFCFFNDKRMKVLEIEKEDHVKLKPGEVSIKNNTLVVGTSDGAIRLTSVQIAGKKVCSDIELLNGLRLNENSLPTIS